VTEKCQDIGDTFGLRRPVEGLDAVAMEQGVADESARGIRTVSAGAESVHGKAVPAIRDKPAERLQMGETLPRGGDRRAAGSVPEASRVAGASERGGRAASTRAATEEGMGTQEARRIAETEVAARRSGSRRTERADHRPNHRAGRLRQEAEAFDAAGRTGDRGACSARGGAQRPVDGGF